MVIILSDGTKKAFEIPRQLTPIQGEPLIVRTIRLLKENGIEDIIITSHDKRFDNLGATRYESNNNNWDYNNETGYWLDAFPLEILNEPTTYLFGDVYYSENAIKTILETPTDDILFFCTYENKSPLYIKEHDEPLAFKVTKIDKFKKHIKIVKKAKDDELCCREPITWELYRSIQGQDINEHKMTKGYIAINDESCDIDTKYDIIKLESILGGNKMVKCKALQKFNLKAFDELKNIQRATVKADEGVLYVGDTFECNNKMAEYLTGNNDQNVTVIEVIEVIPETIKVEETLRNKDNKKVIVEKEFIVEPKKKTTKKKTKKV